VTGSSASQTHNDLKLAYGILAIALFMQQRIKTMTLAFGCIDLLLGALFVLAFFFTPRSEASA
jgi:hypothetical protein